MGGMRRPFAWTVAVAVAPCERATPDLSRCLLLYTAGRFMWQAAARQVLNRMQHAHGVLGRVRNAHHMCNATMRSGPTLGGHSSQTHIFDSQNVGTYG